MKKIWFIALASILLGLVSCGEDDPVEETFYTVSFDADGGTPDPEVQRVKEGDKVTAPSANPAKEGYVFLFWHLSGASTAYNFATPVTGDMTLTAQYEEESAVEYWQVTWNLNGGAWTADDNHAVQVVRGGTLAEPAAPTKAGNTFEGWYKEAGLTNKVTFPYDVSPVTGDFTLYAKWTAEGGGESGTPVVYVSGYVENGSGIYVAKVWKDGEELYALTDGTRNGRANEVFVVGNDVYVAGEEENANGNYIAKVWKNGTELYALNPATESYSAKSIYVSGNDVYVAGSLSSGEDRSPKIWKNGQVLYALADNADVSKICISGSDVYISGYQGSGAKIWKNGSTFWNTSSNYDANADYMYISTGKIYVSANNISKSVASVFEISLDGQVIEELYKYGNSELLNSSADVNTFAVSGGDVYAAVERLQNNATTTWFYKNDDLLYSIVGPQYMYLFGEDIYYVGRTGSGSALKVGKNDTELYTLHEGTSHDWVTSIVVVNSN